jgi:hypothetical protein
MSVVDASSCPKPGNGVAQQLDHYEGLTPQAFKHLRFHAREEHLGGLALCQQVIQVAGE